MFLSYLSIVGIIFFICYPVAIAFDFSFKDLSINIIIVLNALAWIVLFFVYIKQKKLQKYVLDIAKEMELHTKFSTMEGILLKVIENIKKKEIALSLINLDKKIKNKEELLKNLENTVSLAYRILKSDSAELALFDPETKTYHTSYVMGNPSGINSQAMLNNAAISLEKSCLTNIIIQELRFAGTTLGTLRVFFKKGHRVKKSEQDLLSIIAMQGVFAILNASYTDELVKMKRSSNESVKVKTGFLANLSHEIRGPLGIMLNAIELVLDGLCGVITKEQDETLNVVKQNGEHLLDLVNDVLDYAKVESNKLLPQPINIEVNELLKDIAIIMKSQADKKSHTLIFKPLSDNIYINIDKRHIRQIMINLLTNSIKYTPDGGIIELFLEKKDNQHIRINVKDNGVGIEEIDREKVFSAFERIDNDYSIKQVGAGLGMALTKSLVEVNQGKIDFQSYPKNGTLFWIEFPIVSKELNDEAEKEEKEALGMGEGETVLLVEYDENERDLTAKYLKNLGFNVITVSSQTEASDVLNSTDVAVVIVDNVLIDREQDSFVKKIRENVKSCYTPIILVSSKAFSFDVEKYLKDGVDLCLSKPIQLKQLANACRKLVDNQKEFRKNSCRDTRSFRPKDLFFVE